MGELLGYVALAVSFLAVAAFLWAFGWIRLRLARLFAGGEGESLGDALAGQGRRLSQAEREIRSLADRLETLSHRQEEVQADMSARLSALEAHGREALRHAYIHPYSVGDGAPESAVLVLTDEHGNGVLLDVLAGKTVRFYARPVENWQAGRLSQDEEDALRAARKSAEEGGKR